METVVVLDELQKRALHDKKVREMLIDTKKAKDPLAEFCRVSRELGYELYEMDVIVAGEEFYASMRRSTNGGEKIRLCWRVKMISMSCFFPA